MSNSSSVFILTESMLCFFLEKKKLSFSFFAPSRKGEKKRKKKEKRKEKKKTKSLATADAARKDEDLPPDGGVVFLIFVEKGGAGWDGARGQGGGRTAGKSG